MLSCCFVPKNTDATIRPSELKSDEATFSQSSCSLTQLTGEAPSLVLLLQPFCHPLQRCNQWSNESFLHFRYHRFRDFPSVNPRGGCTRKSHWIGSLAPTTVSRSRSLELAWKSTSAGHVCNVMHLNVMNSCHVNEDSDIYI